MSLNIVHLRLIVMWCFFVLSLYLYVQTQIMRIHKHKQIFLISWSNNSLQTHTRTHLQKETHKTRANAWIRIHPHAPTLPQHSTGTNTTIHTHSSTHEHPKTPKHPHPYPHTQPYYTSVAHCQPFETAQSTSSSAPAISCSSPGCLFGYEERVERGSRLPLLSLCLHYMFLTIPGH